MLYLRSKIVNFFYILLNSQTMLKEKWISYILCNLQVDNCKENSICVLLIKYKILSGWWLFGKKYIYRAKNKIFCFM